MKKTLAFIVLWFSAMAAVWAQDTVSGTVTDRNGEPLVGVAVTVPANPTPLGTTTDLDGHYVLSVPDDAVLEFSSLGYHSVSVKVTGGGGVYNVTLEEDNELLDEVVVVGFATQKKVNLTGAVSTLDNEALESVPVHNPVLALQGQIPGLTITQNSG